jgi:DNA-binding HxlR family transcriptional regulator
MRKSSAKTRSACPVNIALETFGDRWSLLVLRDMILFGKRHYRELLESEEGIATNILADRLKKLEAQGLISRGEDPGNRRQVVYEVTEKGLALVPVLLEMMHWAATYDPNTPVSRPFLKRLQQDREGLAAEIITAFRKRAD